MDERKEYLCKALSMRQETVKKFYLNMDQLKNKGVDEKFLKALEFVAGSSMSELIHAADAAEYINGLSDDQIKQIVNEWENKRLI